MAEEIYCSNRCSNTGNNTRQQQQQQQHQQKFKDSKEEEERIEKEEKQVTDDIVKSLESISLLTAEHMTVKGLGSQYNYMLQNKNSSNTLSPDSKSNTVTSYVTAASPSFSSSTSTTLAPANSKAPIRQTSENNSPTARGTSSTGLTIVATEPKAARGGDDVVVVDSEQEQKQTSSSSSSSVRGPEARSYAQLGETFRGLTEKMKETVDDMKTKESSSVSSLLLPYIDEKEDLLLTSRANDDDDPELDAAIREAIGFREDLVVDRIQLEDQLGESSSSSSSRGAAANNTSSVTSALLLASDRHCSGSDVIRVTKNQEVKREFKDV